jgi:hypothetical protein
MRRSLLAITLFSLLLPALAFSQGKSGGVVAERCSLYFTAKDHYTWAKKYKKAKKITKRAARKHKQFVHCAQDKSHARIMIRFWKKVRKRPLPKNHDLWIRIGRCEQPGKGYKGINWSHPGPTYQGGLGFWYGTWNSFKYQSMPANAGSASWRQQMRVANRLLRKYGTSPWGCA